MTDPISFKTKTYRSLDGHIKEVIVAESSILDHGFLGDILDKFKPTKLRGTLAALVMNVSHRCKPYPFFL